MKLENQLLTSLNCQDKIINYLIKIIDGINHEILILPQKYTPRLTLYSYVDC